MVADSQNVPVWELNKWAGRVRPGMLLGMDGSQRTFSYSWGRNGLTEGGEWDGWGWKCGDCSASWTGWFGKGMGGFLGHWAVEGVIGSVEYECV